jgi:hypothetical protein
VNARGRVFRVEEEKINLPNQNGQTMRHRLTVLTAGGLVQAVLEDLSAVRFADPQVKEQVERALAGIARHRAKEQRTLSISLPGGAGAREAGFSYVVSAPVWKSAYRLVLPQAGGKARLQGWAVIENLTGSDWKDADLTLISGNPVALKQQLYTAYFADRPEVPVEASERLLPAVDDGVTPKAKARKPDPQAAARERSAGLGPVRAEAPGYNGPAMQGLGAVGGYSGLSEAIAREDVAKPAMIAGAEDAATQVLYHFPSRLTLASGASMMVPFTDREFTAARAWLYQPDANLQRPLAAVRLTNDSDTALPAGIVTAFDMSTAGAANFTGDAQLPLLASGSTKYVTFALDTKTAVRRTDRGIKRVRLGKAVNGELTVMVRSQWTIEYEITPPAGEDREIVVDETRSQLWKPVGELREMEETPSRLRFKVAAAKGQTTRAELRLENTESQTVALTSLTPQQFLVTLSGLESAGPALKEAASTLGAMVARLNKIAERRKELAAENKRIVEDQERLRLNLTAAGTGSDLGRRYLDELKAQEDRLAAIAAEGKSLDAGEAAERSAAEALARTLTL